MEVQNKAFIFVLSNHKKTFQNMKIELKEKNVYGNTLLYPNCEVAKKFADLLKVKTFNTYQISMIKQLEYEVVIISI